MQSRALVENEKLVSTARSKLGRHGTPRNRRWSEISSVTLEKLSEKSVEAVADVTTRESPPSRATESIKTSQPDITTSRLSSMSRQSKLPAEHQSEIRGKPEENHEQGDEDAMEGMQSSNTRNGGPDDEIPDVENNLLTETHIMTSRETTKSVLGVLSDHEDIIRTYNLDLDNLGYKKH